MIEIDNSISAISRQRKLFGLLDEFFQRATGTTACKFATFDDFADTIRKNASKVGPRGAEAFCWLDENIRPFYAKTSTPLFQEMRKLAGIKMVLGGGSRFKETQFNSVRKMVLYTDTILIPDPVFPWLETGREEERFRHVNLLEAAFGALHLKPLIDADLPTPAVLMFPSWERLLGEHDQYTKEGVQTLVLDVISDAIGRPFASDSELLQFVDTHSTEFLEAVDRGRLFVAPGGNVDEPLSEAIPRYKDELKMWRSREHLDLMLNLSDSRFVLNGIIERLGPQFHLIDNSEELDAHPLLCLEATWHYHRIVSRVAANRLVHGQRLSPSTMGKLEALRTERFSWLGNVPIESLVDLRRNNENHWFREKLDHYLSHLHESSFNDVEKVAIEIEAAIRSLLFEHQRDIESIATKSKRGHIQTAVDSWLTVGATMLPWLAPFVGKAAPMGLLLKYGWGKFTGKKELQGATKSMMGVLANLER